MPAIFLSYRRDDSADAAGRLHDRLENHFGRDSIFMDVDAIPFGVDFREYLDQAVSRCDVLLAVIGERWLDACHGPGPKQGQRRLDDPSDFVAIEIRSALARKIPVIPVLVGKAAMPGEDDLPEGLKALAYRNAAEVRSDRDFHDHVSRLIRGIEYLTRQGPEEQERQARERARLQQEGEALLVRRYQEVLERTQGKPAEQDKAALKEVCRQHGLPSERANALLREERRRWEEAHPARKEPRPGEVVSNSLGMKFAWCPPGAFLMGSPKSEERGDDETQHRVTLTQGFWLGVTPVTQGQWQAVTGGNPSRFKGDDRPVENVSWADCQAFCEQLDRKDGKRYRLPTEAEWEYACRAGTTTPTPFHFGNTISTDQANYNGNYTYGEGKKGVYRQQTTPVGSFPANAWGLFDMHGNVWEWCADWYGPCPSEEIKDPQGSKSGEARVLRGGSWIGRPYWCRAAARIRNAPAYRCDSYGCRLVLCLD